MKKLYSIIFILHWFIFWQYYFAIVIFKEELQHYQKNVKVMDGISFNVIIVAIIINVISYCAAAYGSVLLG